MYLPMLNFLLFFFSVRLTGLFTLWSMRKCFGFMVSLTYKTLLFLSHQSHGHFYDICYAKNGAHTRWITVTKFSRNKTLMSIELNSSVGCWPNNRWQMKRFKIPWKVHTAHNNRSSHHLYRHGNECAFAHFQTKRRCTFFVNCTWPTF